MTNHKVSFKREKNCLLWIQRNTVEKCWEFIPVMYLIFCFEWSIVLSLRVAIGRGMSNNPILGIEIEPVSIQWQNSLNFRFTNQACLFSNNLFWDTFCKQLIDIFQYETVNSWSVWFNYLRLPIKKTKRSELKCHEQRNIIRKIRAKKKTNGRT